MCVCWWRASGVCEVATYLSLDVPCLVMQACAARHNRKNELLLYLNKPWHAQPVTPAG